MAIKLNSNFDYRGSHPNFERDIVETFEELKNLSGYPDGHLVYCKETKLHYKYNEELESEETGKFEEFKTGGGIEIVSSVEELDPDAELGSLASIVSFATVPLSEDYKYGKTLTEKLRIIFPSHVDFSIMWNGAASKAFFITRTSINPIVNVYSHIAIEVKLVDTTYTISWGTSPMQGMTMGLEVYAEYDLNGDLLSSQENVPDLGELKYKTTYLDLSEEELLFLDNFVTLSEKKADGTLFIKNSSGWEQYSELVDQSVTTEKVADGAITVEKISDSSVTLEKLSTDVQDKFTAIESQLTSRSTSIDFGANEDTTTLAIMDPSVITKIKTMNVSNLYISYGDVVKQEIDLSLSEQNIDLGDADFIVINITRTTDEIDAALGLTFINRTV